MEVLPLTACRFSSHSQLNATEVSLMKSNLIQQQQQIMTQVSSQFLKLLHQRQAMASVSISNSCLLYTSDAADE